MAMLNWFKNVDKGKAIELQNIGVSRSYENERNAVDDFNCSNKNESTPSVSIEKQVKIEDNHNTNKEKFRAKKKSLSFFHELNALQKKQFLEAILVGDLELAQRIYSQLKLKMSEIEYAGFTPLLAAVVSRSYYMIAYVQSLLTRDELDNAWRYIKFNQANINTKKIMLDYSKNNPNQDEMNAIVNYFKANKNTFIRFKYAGGKVQFEQDGRLLFFLQGRSPYVVQQRLAKIKDRISSTILIVKEEMKRWYDHISTTLSTVSLIRGEKRYDPISSMGFENHFQFIHRDRANNIKSILTSPEKMALMQIARSGVISNFYERINQTKQFTPDDWVDMLHCAIYSCNFSFFKKIMTHLEEKESQIWELFFIYDNELVFLNKENNYSISQKPTLEELRYWFKKSSDTFYQEAYGSCFLMDKKKINKVDDANLLPSSVHNSVIFSISNACKKVDASVEKIRNLLSEKKFKQKATKINFFNNQAHSLAEKSPYEAPTALPVSPHHS